MREENRQHWSPFFPICPNCKSVYATRVTEYHPDRQTLEFVCDIETESYKGCGEGGEISVLGGNVKMGWKVDWALRWFSYDVDYEMYGKDLIDSFQTSSRIVRIMGKQPPVGYKFEHFNDEHGEKISSSVGKGLTVDAWVRYAPIESLLYFLFQNPNRAKRLFWAWYQSVLTTISTLSVATTMCRRRIDPTRCYGTCTIRDRTLSDRTFPIRRQGQLRRRE